MNLQQRSEELEIMDDLNISGDVVPQTLHELDVINRLLGGNQISLSAFRSVIKKGPVRSLVDLGCGSGDILIHMSRISPNTEFTGIDANKHIIDYASNHTRQFDTIHTVCENIFSDSFKKRTYDVIHCCLFLHHFTKEELIQLFTQFKSQAQKAIIVNDLHRHFLAYHSIKWITRLFSKSYMVRNDAAVSVARGFKREELEKILTAAGISNYSLKWKWAFRWKLIIQISE